METLITKSNSIKSSIQRNPLLDLFKRDIIRDLHYADLVGYQLDLGRVIDKAIELYPDENHDMFPSWSKLSKSPTRGKGWYTVMLQAVFNGQHSLDHLNKDLQLEETNNETGKPCASMMFFSHGTSNSSMGKLTKITQDALPNWAIISVYGNAKFRSGKKVKNSTAEKYVKEEIERARTADPNKNILIIAAQMAQRSFSEGLIDEIYLAYDNGAEGATIQKMARALTGNGTSTKRAKIFSLSFDPNRDDKIQCLVLQSAINMMEKDGENNPTTYIKQVLSSLDIWSCQSSGSRVKWDATNYVQDVLSKQVAARVLGQQIDVSKLTYAQMILLSKGLKKATTSEKAADFLKGKTHAKLNNGESSSVDSNKQPKAIELEAKERLIGLLESSSFFIESTIEYGSTDITTSLDCIEEHGLTLEVEEEFNLPFELIRMIFDEDVIKRNHVNLINTI